MPLGHCSSSDASEHADGHPSERRANGQIARGRGGWRELVRVETATILNDHLHRQLISAGQAVEPKRAHNLSFIDSRVMSLDPTRVIPSAYVLSIRTVLKNLRASARCKAVPT